MPGVEALTRWRRGPSRSGCERGHPRYRQYERRHRRRGGDGSWRLTLATSTEPGDRPNPNVGLALNPLQLPKSPHIRQRTAPRWDTGASREV